jgi:uncharacterized protein with HEPN domain
MSKRDSHELLIDDIIECGDKILRYTHNMSYDDFASNDLVLDAVIRNFEIIGEAANRLSDDFKDLYPTIEWHRIRGFRNRIVHDYAGVDTTIVWGIITNFLPDMLIRLKSI